MLFSVSFMSFMSFLSVGCCNIKRIPSATGLWPVFWQHAHEGSQPWRALLEKADAWPATWLYLYVSFLHAGGPRKPRELRKPEILILGLSLLTPWPKRSHLVSRGPICLISSDHSPSTVHFVKRWHVRELESSRAIKTTRWCSSRGGRMKWPPQDV